MGSGKISAGILLYRKQSSATAQLEFFLVHPGGPFWKNKDEGVWSIPKGEINAQWSMPSAQSESGREILLEVAKREFCEETSFQTEDCIEGEFIPLSPVKLKSGKTVYAFAAEGNIDAEKIVSNTFLFEWPPKSGKKIEIPEVDRGAWFDYETAKMKINPGQVPLLEEVLNVRGSPPAEA